MTGAREQSGCAPATNLLFRFAAELLHRGTARAQPIGGDHRGRAMAHSNPYLLKALENVEAGGLILFDEVPEH